MLSDLLQICLALFFAALVVLGFWLFVNFLAWAANAIGLSPEVWNAIYLERLILHGG